MRSASSYRGAKKKAAREAGVTFAKFNDHFAKSRMFAAHELERKALSATPEAARRALAIWAANGGRATAVSPAVTDTALAAMNRPPAMEPLGEKEPVISEREVAAAQDAAKKITVSDVDKAMESALNRWQASGREDPMPLNPLFAVRARQLGWVENVEFIEEK